MKRAAEMSYSSTSDSSPAVTWSIVLSGLMIAAGVVAVFMPALAGVAVTAIVGWLLIFSGLLHVAFAWRANRASDSALGDLARHCLRRCGHLSCGESSGWSPVAHDCSGNLPVRRGRPGVRPFI